MVFSSPIFLFILFTAVFLLYFVLPKKARNYILIVASLIFYAWGEPVYILLMLGSVLVNYILALLIEKSDKHKIWLVICIVLNIGALFIFKYSNFFVDNVNAILGTSIAIPRVRLPIGISFFTFQAMSYVIDVYRGVNKAQKKFSNVLLYISFFPQLIAGPIVKYHDIATQIEKRTISVDKITQGLKRFTVGLCKKLILANTMGYVADRVFALVPSEANIIIAWIGALTYALQIYFDFSGYSDMAIGLAKIFGFELKENFDYPYTARSIKTFWRKWHISLSTWFKEYLYIPLGGNRKSEARTSINLIIVFFCTGLWHGAEWTFVVWGFFHGLFIMLERLNVIKPDKFKPKWLGNVYTMLVVVIAFTIFRAETFSQSLTLIAKMFTGFTSTIGTSAFVHETVTISFVVFFVVSIFAATPIAKNIYYKLKDSTKINPILFETVTMAVTLIMLFLCMMILSAETYNPFIYYRF